MTTHTTTTASQNTPASRSTRRLHAHRVGTRRLVSALWLFAILNYLYCDVLGTHDPAYLRDIIDGTAAVTMSQPVLLGASVLMTIPMLAVLLTRVAPHRTARWYSLAAASVMTLVQAASLFVGTATGYYWYFSVIEIVTTATIVYLCAARWSEDS